MPGENITPEEKLLKLIENPSDKQTISSLGKVYKSSFRVKNWMKAVKDFKTIKGALSSLEFKIVIRLLLGVSFLLSAFLIFDFFQGQKNSKRNLERILSTSSHSKVKKTLVSLLGRDKYIKEVQRRNIFSSMEKAPVGKSISIDIVSKVKDLKLVGILWSDNPQAMIEDTKEAKTYLLNIGDEINQMKIKKIFRDKVIIEAEDKEWELR